jgi:hypothetical protein
MAQSNNSQHKTSKTLSAAYSLSLEGRIDLLANIIVDRIIDDQTSGQQLLTQLGIVRDAKPA